MEIMAVTGIGEVTQGDDVATLIADALGFPLASGDIVVVTHKIVSKAEGAVRSYATEEERRRIVEGEASSVIRRRGDLTITLTKHGFICANAGVDRSNAAPGTLVLLPDDPDRSAQRIRAKLEHRFSVSLGVVITDTFGRAWRTGLTDVAIGLAGLPALVDHRGTTDTHGNMLEVTEVAVADEIAAAADLVMGKASGIPVAIVRGLTFTPTESGRAADLVRETQDDLFR
jgi:coenzyme F420-0:L-glutamate ligase/coenzyme F420-1:gamma-L-glutamate ligase